ncbi:hypothetical protein ACROYT_G023755 [Oculina patagonica]
MYDFINLGKKGVNWASNLDAYNRILNEESKEELGWKSPFEVYFGRKSNILVKESLDEAEVDMDNCIVKTPKRKDYNRHFGNVKKLRKRALRYSRRMNERMVKRYARLCKTPAYKRGDEVLVRYRPDRRGNIPPKRRVVLKGTIVKKGKTNAMYKVRIVPPKSEKEIEKWDDHLETFSAMGYSVVHNPRGDGNCQFEALRFWLQRLGFYRSEESIREEIVRYLTQNPFNADGIPLENFAAMPWDRYLTAMSQDGEYGDHLTLQAAADIFNIEIVVVSSLGPDATVVISPTSSIPVATIQLGHFAEGDGEHYVCVEGEEEQEDLEESREFSRQYESSNASVEQEQGQSVFKTDNNVQVRFVSDSMLVMNNLNDNNSNNSQEVTGIRQILPTEVIDMIIKMALISSGFSWPNHVCSIYNKFRNVNRLFRDCVKKWRHRLPRIYFPLGEIGYVSVAKLIRQYGSHSGLLLEIKRIISHPRWNSAWLKLLADGNGWFIIVNIIWRKKDPT